MSSTVTDFKAYPRYAAGQWRRVDLIDSGRRHLKDIRVGSADPARHRQRELLNQP
jgi:hypothetical protein